MMKRRQLSTPPWKSKTNAPFEFKIYSRDRILYPRSVSSSPKATVMPRNGFLEELETEMEETEIVSQTLPLLRRTFEFWYLNLGEVSKPKNPQSFLSSSFCLETGIKLNLGGERPHHYCLQVGLPANDTVFSILEAPTTFRNLREASSIITQRRPMSSLTILSRTTRSNPSSQQ